MDDPTEHNLIKALGHPLRLRLLEALVDHQEASPTELARRFGQSVSTVSRHVRMLEALGFIELVRTEPRRGTFARYYRATQLPYLDDEQWERLPIPLRRGLARQTFRKIFAEASAAGAAGGFDAPEAHVDRMPVRLDQTGRRELSEALNRLLRETEAIQGRSDARNPGGVDPGGVDPGCLALLHFLSPNEEARGPAPDPQRPRLP